MENQIDDDELCAVSMMQLLDNMSFFSSNLILLSKL